MPVRAKELYGIAVCNYAGDVDGSLPLSVGDVVVITDECEGWYQGVQLRDRTLHGFFPANHIHKKCSSKRCRSRICMDQSEKGGTIIEVGNVLREWVQLWKKLYVETDHDKFEAFRKLLIKLFTLRRQFLTGTLTQDQINDLKMRITANIDWGNRVLGLDLVPRIHYEIVDPSRISILDLYDIHTESVEACSAVKRGSKALSYPAPEPSEASDSFHVFIKLREISYRVCEDWELYFSIYDSDAAKFVSERYLVRVPKKGDAQFNAGSFCEENHGAVFTGLGNKDMDGALHLVCQVFRVGKILPGDSSRKPCSQNYRRPLGCWVQRLTKVAPSGCSTPCTPVSRGGVSDALTPPVFVDMNGSVLANGGSSARTLLDTSLGGTDKDETLLSGTIYACEQEKDFHQLHDLVVKKLSNKFAPLSNQSAYPSLDVDIRILRGSMQRVVKEEPLIFNSYPVVQKKGFSDVIMPGDIRNDLFLTLCRGEFEKAGRNVQVQITVIDGQTGSLIESIYPAVTGKEDEGQKMHQSMILYHQNTPVWEECVRLSIPVDKFPAAIVRLEFFHCSKKNERKLFGVAFRKLMDEEGCSIRDGVHGLAVQSCDDLNKITREEQEIYLKTSDVLSFQASEASLSSLSSQMSATSSMSVASSLSPASTGVEFWKRGVSWIGNRGGKDMVFIRTHLCSTKFTQNVDLFALLNRKNSKFAASDVLNRVMTLDGEELVKFLHHILDELFGMFSTESGESTPWSGQVFQVLINIFTTLNDTKFRHFKTVLETYIRDHFAAALVYKGLITCVNHCAEKLIHHREPDKSQPAVAVLKAFETLEYIFKFLVQSRILFARWNGGRNEDAFKSDVFVVMDSLRAILASPTHRAEFLRTQMAILKNLPQVVQELARVFPVAEIGVVAVGLVQCMPGSSLPNATCDWSSYMRYSTKATMFLVEALKMGERFSSSSAPPAADLMDAKLACLKEMWTTCLAEDKDARAGLLRVISYHCCVHLRSKRSMEKTVDLVFSVLSSLVKLDEKEESDKKKARRALVGDVEEYDKSEISEDEEEEEDLYGNCGSLALSSQSVRETPTASHDDVAILVKNSPYIVEALLDCIYDMERDSPVIGRLVTSLMALLKLMDASHYEDFWAVLSPKPTVNAQNYVEPCYTNRDFAARGDRDERNPLKDLLLKIILVFKDIIVGRTFPSDWLVMEMVTNEVILNVTKQIANPLQRWFLKGPQFSCQLWINYLSLAVTFITQPVLQVEKFSDSKRLKILRNCDMRLAMGAHVMSMWSKIDNEERLGIIPALVGPFLDMTLVAQPLLRKRTIPIFFQIMETELFAKGNFKQVESELIDKLDILVSENKGDESFKESFQIILTEKVRDSLWEVCENWKDCALGFIKSVTDLLERLLDYRRVIRANGNREKSKICIVNLLGFYKDIKREELYLRYVYKLHQLHLEGKCYAEAACALKLHADLLSWAPRMMHADDMYPAQVEWQRKETLYLEMIKYFDLGGCWEKCIPLCKELANLYETRVYDFIKLSEAHKRLATFYDNILTKLRLGSEYFRVGCYGAGFPSFLRNKEFVFRGLECERVGDFTMRLQLEFPEAQLLMKNTPPDDSVRNSQGQFLQVCCVRPTGRTFRPDFATGDLVDPGKISEKIRAYYDWNDVSAFQYDRPISRGNSGGVDNEFKNRWIERTTLKIRSSLPGILTGFEVIERREQMIEPIDHACETLSSTNKELRTLMASYEADPKKNLNPLSMRLTGIIDAAVMGGLPKYQEAFLSCDDSYSEESVNKLKALIQEQMNITASALVLHGNLVPAEMIPLQQRLVSMFTDLERRMQCRSQVDIQLVGSSSSASIIKQKSFSMAPATTGSSQKNHLAARRARSEASDRRKQPSIVNTPLPPIPLAERNSQLSLGSTISRQHRRTTSTLEEEDDKIYCKPSEWRDDDDEDSEYLVADGFEYSEPLAHSQYYSEMDLFDAGFVMNDARRSQRSAPSPSLVTNSSMFSEKNGRLSQPDMQANRLSFGDTRQRSISGTDVFDGWAKDSSARRSAELSGSTGPPVPPRAKPVQAPDAPPLPPRGSTGSVRLPMPQTAPPPLPKRLTGRDSSSLSTSCDEEFIEEDTPPPLPPKHVHPPNAPVATDSGFLSYASGEGYTLVTSSGPPSHPPPAPPGYNVPTLRTANGVSP